MSEPQKFVYPLPLAIQLRDSSKHWPTAGRRDHLAEMATAIRGASEAVAGFATKMNAVGTAMGRVIDAFAASKAKS